MKRVFPGAIILICFLSGLFTISASGTPAPDGAVTTSGGMTFNEHVRIPSFVSISGLLGQQSSAAIVNQGVLNTVVKSAIRQGIWCSPVMDWFSFSRYIAGNWYPPAGYSLSELVYRKTHSRIRIF